MSYFKNNKVLLWVIIVLLVVNVSAVGTMIYRNQNRTFRSPDFEEGPQHFLKKRLNLKEDQMCDFKELHFKFRKSMHSMIDGMQQNKTDLYNELMKPDPDTLKLHQLAAEYGEIHKKIKMRTVDLFIEMKQNITPEQQASFRLLLREMSDMEGFKDDQDRRERFFRNSKKRRDRKNR
jgi:Spy/CpxP family protein refolding chaperone